MGEEDAVRDALRTFGDARSIARLMDEAHSRGSWTEALIGCQPHLIVAALFATHVWRHPLLLAAAFGAIVVIALLGWRSGGTPWMYTWIGYAVLPLLVASYLSMDPVARTVSFLATGHGAPAPLFDLAIRAILYVFTLWLIASTAVTVARRDWILLSLMLLPLPVLGLWIVTITQSGGVLADAVRSLESRFSRWDTAMGYFFAALGITTALFVRVRQRALKVGTIILVGMVGHRRGPAKLLGRPRFVPPGRGVSGHPPLPYRPPSSPHDARTRAAPRRTPAVLSAVREPGFS